MGLGAVMSSEVLDIDIANVCDGQLYGKYSYNHIDFYFHHEPSGPRILSCSYKGLCDYISNEL